MKEIVLALAKAAIAITLGKESDFDLDKALHDYPALKENGAAFVTLTQGANDDLRGCIGTLEAYQPLYKDIIANARSAAMRDPRFHPLAPEEFDYTHIEVSILTPPTPVSYGTLDELRSKIRPGIDGVVLKLHGHRATYLPQVWEDLPNFDIFFASLCQKAGLRQSCLGKHPDIEIYQVTKYR